LRRTRSSPPCGSAAGTWVSASACSLLPSTTAATPSTTGKTAPAVPPLPGLRAYCEALGGRLDLTLPTITPVSWHGRSSAVQRHRRRREPLCEECRLYERERARAYRARVKEAAA
jgi:hypothetical protein